MSDDVFQLPHLMRIALETESRMPVGWVVRYDSHKRGWKALSPNYDASGISVEAQTPDLLVKRVLEHLRVA